MTGGYSGAFYTDSDSRVTKELNIGEEYGIQKVKLSGGCRWTRVSFDYLGRPFMGNLSKIKQPYQTNRLIKKTCYITLSDSSDNKITIAVEPETGYVHIL